MTESYSKDSNKHEDSQLLGPGVQGFSRNSTSNHPLNSYPVVSKYFTDPKIMETQLRLQDHHLDSVAISIKGIKEQSNLIHSELEQQSILLDDINRGTDDFQDKLDTSSKGLNYYHKQSKKRYFRLNLALAVVLFILILVFIFV